MQESDVIAWIICGGIGSIVLCVLAIQLFTPANPIGSSLKLLGQFRDQETELTSSKNVKSSIDGYNDLHDAESPEERNKNYKSLVNSYYDLATLFYEWGWGQSFHFANRYPNESFAESIKRHEYYLASKLALGSGGGGNNNTTPSVSKIVDVGCGIGGPLRNICKFTGADVTGLTINQYQVQRGNSIIDGDPWLGTSRCRLVQGDFMQMPFEDSVFDGAYAIEATCHAPDRVGVYSEIYRVLKPGSVFACYEWCMTDEYDPDNQLHRKMKKYIEEGDGLPDICHTSECLNAMKASGFEILEEKDIAGDGYGGKSWVEPLVPSWNPLSQRFQFNWLGRALVSCTLSIFECLCLAPKGTTKAQRMLMKGQEGICYSGQMKTFTPMYLMVGRVPFNKMKHT